MRGRKNFRVLLARPSLSLVPFACFDEGISEKFLLSSRAVQHADNGFNPNRNCADRNCLNFLRLNVLYFVDKTPTPADGPTPEPVMAPTADPDVAPTAEPDMPPTASAPTAGGGKRFIGFSVVGAFGWLGFIWRWHQLVRSSARLCDDDTMIAAGGSSVEAEFRVRQQSGGTTFWAE